MHDNKHQMEGFYKVAYQTAHERMDLPKDQFRSLLPHLIAGKDHEKVLHIVSKVEKHYHWDGRGKSGATPYERNTEQAPGVLCFYCHKFGHIRAHCLQRKKDMLGKAGKGQQSHPLQKW